MDQEISRIQDKYDKLSEKVATAQVDISTLKTQLNQYGMQMNATDNRLQNILGSYGTYERELEIFQDNLKNLSAEIKEISNEVKNIKVDLALLRSDSSKSMTMWKTLIVTFFTGALSIAIGRMFP